MKQKHWLLGCASALILSAMSGVAYAQDDASSGDADDAERREDPIIVTAKARAQNLQDVPLAISVFSEEDLELRSISDVQDLADFTPNLEINSSTGRREASLSVRGLGSSTTDERYQSVGFFVDGIWMGGQIVGLSTSDVERIEVIKGPHSTFGRATYGASIDYVTKTPSLEEFEGSFKAQLSNSETGLDNNYEITGAISGPIVPGKVSGSLFIQQRFDSGVALATPAATLPAGIVNQTGSAGEEETSVISGVLYTEFSDQTSLKLRALYTEDNDTMINGYDSGPQYWIQQGANIVQTGSGQAWVNGEVPDPPREGYYAGDFRTARLHLDGLAPGTFEREKIFLSAIFDHEFDNGYSLNYRGSFMEQEEDAIFDGLAAPGRAGGIDITLGDVSGLSLGFGGGFENLITEEWQEISHTARLLSPDNERFTWSVGAYLYDSENQNDTPNIFFVENFAPATNTTGINRIEEIDTMAVFGDLSYQITDQFSVDLEARWQEETVTRVAVPDALFSSQRLGTDIEQTNSNIDPRITFSYEPNDDHHLYVLYAEGQKSGRFNLSNSGPFLADGTRDPRTWVFVRPEELKNYEAGWKAFFMDGRARTNVAVFFQDIKNQQFVSSVVDPNNPVGLVTQLANVGGSEIFGFEADAAFAATDKLTFTGAIGYNDQEFQNDVDPQSSANTYIFNLAGDAVGSETLKGKSFTNVPKWSGNLSGTYRAPTTLFGSQEWSLRGDLLYKGKKYVDTANLAYIPDNVRVNLRTALEGENWTLALFANNLFDDETAYRGDAFPCGLNSVTDPAVASQLGLGTPAPAINTAAGQRCLSLLPSPSREIGASLQVRF